MVRTTPSVQALHMSPSYTMPSQTADLQPVLVSLAYNTALSHCFLHLRLCIPSLSRAQIRTSRISVHWVPFLSSPDSTRYLAHLPTAAPPPSTSFPRLSPAHQAGPSQYCKRNTLCCSSRVPSAPPPDAPSRSNTAEYSTRRGRTSHSSGSGSATTTSRRGTATTIRVVRAAEAASTLRSRGSWRDSRCRGRRGRGHAICPNDTAT